MRNAGLQMLRMPKSPKAEEVACTSARSTLSALSSSRAVTASLSSASPGSARLKPPEYAALGDYRPPIQNVRKPPHSENIEFQQMLAMIGEKVRQKFSKAREVFRFVDSDHSGTISRSEVQFFFRFFNVHSDEADKFFDGFDRDEDGEISYVEFVKYLWPYCNPGNEQEHWCLAKHKDIYHQQKCQPTRVFIREVEELQATKLPLELNQARVNIAQRLELRYKNRRDAFRDLDYDRDGTVTLTEMRYFFGLFGWESIAERFYEVLSSKGGGEVRFDTFAQLFNVSKDSDMRLRL